MGSPWRNWMVPIPPISRVYYEVSQLRVFSNHFCCLVLTTLWKRNILNYTSHENIVVFTSKYMYFRSHSSFPLMWLSKLNPSAGQARLPLGASPTCQALLDIVGDPGPSSISQVSMSASVWPWHLSSRFPYHPPPSFSVVPASIKFL